MTTLALQQQALLDALFQRQASEAAVQQTRQALRNHLHLPGQYRGLMAYRANGHGLAERALQAAYPVIAAMIGARNFGPLAHDLWHAHPPTCGDLAQWGHQLPAFLAGHAQLAGEPCLADVARVEWALHQAAGAPDNTADLASFARLSHEDPQGLTLTLAPGTVVFNSPWPVASLVTAHCDAQPTLEEAGRRLHAGVGESAVVWRQGHRPRVSHCSATDAALLAALLRGLALPDALHTLGDDPLFNLSAWLSEGVRRGLLTGVVDVSAPTPSRPIPHKETS